MITGAAIRGSLALAQHLVANATAQKEFSVPSCVHVAVVGFISEVGDKTFFLTVILAAWCPFTGVRYSTWSAVEQLLVWAGAVLAVVLRLLLIETGMTLSFFDLMCGLLALVGSVASGIAALVELKRADLKQKEMRRSGAKEPTAHTSASAALLTEGGLLGNVKLYQGNTSLENDEFLSPTGYASVLQERDSTRGEFLAAFFLPSLFCFVAEAGDKSQAVISATAASSLGLAEMFVGVTLGSAFALAAAVVLGFLLERTLSDRRLLWTAVSVLFALSAIFFSETFLKIYGFMRYFGMDGAVPIGTLGHL